MKRWVPHLGIAAGVLLVGYAVFARKSDEERIRGRLRQLEQSVEVSGEAENPVFRAARLRKDFADLFNPDVSTAIPELGPDLGNVEKGRAGLVQLAAMASQRYERARIDLGGLAIKLDADEAHAIATGDATLSGSRGGRPQVDRREVSLRFEKIDGEWKIAAVAASRSDERDSHR